jgi:hypothetical protein
MTPEEKQEQGKTIAEVVGEMLPDMSIVAEGAVVVLDVVSQVVDLGEVVVTAIGAVAEAISD